MEVIEGFFAIIIRRFNGLISQIMWMLTTDNLIINVVAAIVIVVLNIFLYKKLKGRNN